MRIKANKFRYGNVLPNRLIEDLAQSRFNVTGIAILEGFKKEKNWYNAEQYVEVILDEPGSPEDASEVIRETCGSCGMCCENIPAHQIGIYMSETEINKAVAQGHDVILQGTLVVERVNFGLLGVKANGDCAMLDEHGCTLGSLKPLWCKIYHCEVYQGGEYQYADMHAQRILDTLKPSLPFDPKED